MTWRRDMPPGTVNDDWSGALPGCGCCGRACGGSRYVDIPSYIYIHSDPSLDGSYTWTFTGADLALGFEGSPLSCGAVFAAMTEEPLRLLGRDPTPAESSVDPDFCYFGSTNTNDDLNGTLGTLTAFQDYEDEVEEFSEEKFPLSRGDISGLSIDLPTDYCNQAYGPNLVYSETDGFSGFRREVRHKFEVFGWNYYEGKVTISGSSGVSAGGFSARAWGMLHTARMNDTISDISHYYTSHLAKLHITRTEMSFSESYFFGLPIHSVSVTAPASPPTPGAGLENLGPYTGGTNGRRIQWDVTNIAAGIHKRFDNSNIYPDNRGIQYKVTSYNSTIQDGP